MYYLYRSLFFLSFLALNTEASYGQKLKKADKLIIGQLERHHVYLSDRKVAAEQKIRMEYIAGELKKNGVMPKEPAGYLCSFVVPEGMESSSGSVLLINGEKIAAGEYIPFLNSPDISLEASPSPALQESGEPWFFDISELAERLAAGAQEAAAGPAAAMTANKALIGAILTKAKDAAGKGATALFVYNKSRHPDGLTYNSLEKQGALPLPVVYIKPGVANNYLKDETAMLDIQLTVKSTEKKGDRVYVAGLIDNRAQATTIIQATDDSSGAPVLIELARLLKNNRAKDKNYLIVAFSDEHSGDETVQHTPPLKADYQIEVASLKTDIDKLQYIQSMLEKLR